MRSPRICVRPRAKWLSGYSTARDLGTTPAGCIATSAESKCVRCSGIVCGGSSTRLLRRVKPSRQLDNTLGRDANAAAMGRVTTVASSVRSRYCGLLPADVISPHGPPLCTPPICGPSPRLSRHDLIAASCCGVIRPPTCFCASWWSCWIFCCFCCGVREESLHTASIWLCVFSSICLRCCIAD